MKANFYNRGQSLFGIIIVLVIVGLLGTGFYVYLSKQIPEVPQIAEKLTEEVASEEQPTPPPEKVAPTSEPEKPIVQKCADGTLYGRCSTNKPKYCDSGILVNKATICGCPSSYQIYNNECQKIPISYMFVIEDDGTMIYNDNRIDEMAVTKKFYKTHGDDYDFVSIYTAFTTDRPLAPHHTPAKNDVKGIGLNLFDSSNSYGSNGKLKGVNFGREIDGYDNFQNIFNSLLHETAHQWAAYIGDDKGSGGKLEITVDGVHWYFGVSSGWDTEGGLSYIDNGNGTFTVAAPTNSEWPAYKASYSPLTQYLMGIISPEEVPDMLVVTPTNGSYPGEVPGTVFSGTARYVSIADVIAAEGKRIPSSANSQKNFTMAFILLTQKGKNATQEQIDKLEYIVDNFPEAWAEASNYKSTMNANP